MEWVKIIISFDKFPLNLMATRNIPSTSNLRMTFEVNICIMWQGHYIFEGSHSKHDQRMSSSFHIAWNSNDEAPKVLEDLRIDSQLMVNSTEEYTRCLPFLDFESCWCDSIAKCLHPHCIGTEPRTSDV